MKALFIGGIMAIAVVAGVFEALASPRRRDEADEKKEDRKEESKAITTRLQ